MSNDKSELQKKNVLRLSNEESNKITRECIQTALIYLLSEKELDKITITEIAKKAGVSRTAFYRNYTSKEEVLLASSNELLNRLTNLAWQAITEKSPYIFYETIFSTVRDNSERFSLLLKSGLLNQDFMDIGHFISSRYEDCNAQIHYILLGWSGLIKNIQLGWYLGGMKEDIDVMAKLCCDLTTSMIHKAKEIHPDFLCRKDQSHK